MSLALVACAAPTANELESAPSERPSLAFTDWSASTELFVELPALVVGLDSPFAAHVTRLSDFSALTTGHVAVVLRSADGTAERFEVDEVLRAGIFRPVVRPTRAGPSTLSIEVQTDGIEVVHNLGEVTVYADQAAATLALADQASPPSGRVVFLKEQQWTIEFGTEPALMRELRPSIRVFGRIEARPEGDVVVRAPSAGRIVGDAFPTLGAHVERDVILAGLAQRLDATDRASLDLARASARMDVAQAERERARLEALRAEGAIPERRLLEAQHVEAEARAALMAAERRTALFERTLRSGGSGSGSLPIRSPIDGDVVAIEVGPGALVAEGDDLFRIVAPGSLWLALDIPEADLPRLGEVLAAAFLVPGEASEREVSAADLVARSLVVDPASHTSIVRFSIDDPRVALGTHVEARLFVEAAASALTIPWAAVLDDGGMSVAFVQVEGEAFERRVVRLGVRDGSLVEVTSGIAEGERVVTRGALAVRLAASSGTIPAHGHTH